MTAHLLDPEHIHVLVHAGLDSIGWFSDDTRTTPTEANGLFDAGRYRLRRLTHQSANTVGQLLVDANTASVNSHYAVTSDAPGYTYRQPVRAGEPIEILRAIEGYEFQASDSEGWEDHPEARRYCDELRRATVRRLHRYHDANTWEITPTTKSFVEYPARDYRRTTR